MEFGILKAKLFVINEMLSVEYDLQRKFEKTKDEYKQSLKNEIELLDQKKLLLEEMKSHLETVSYK
jgi:hypothetical protein